MYKTTRQFRELHHARSSRPVIDKYVVVPILACVYSSIIWPLSIVVSGSASTLNGAVEGSLENRIFWPIMAGISLALALQHRSRLGGYGLPPHIICLLAYLAFAGASVLWAFRPEIAFIRFVQEVMIITSIILPAMLAARTADLMLGVFLCFALASILNALFILGGSGQEVILNLGKKVSIGYTGYFTTKNLLGECAAIALLLAVHEFLHHGLRRMLGIIIAVIATWILFLSSSKTALGLALLVPLLARFTLIARKITGVSPAIILGTIPIFFFVLSNVSNFNMGRISYMLYGDSTFTGRTTIWDFARIEIERRPLLGWGYKSFWFVGPDGPSVEAPGWVKMMPNSHNGYYDMMLELGYVGLVFLVIFLVATIHATGRVADRDPARARLLLSLVLFVVLYNFLESLWLRAFDTPWVVFLVVVAEIGRHWQPLHPKDRTRAGDVAQPTRSRIRSISAR